MGRMVLFVALLALTGCLATDPAARNAAKQEKAAFREAVANLRSFQGNFSSKFNCRPLGQVIGKGGLAPRTYEKDMQHAIEMAKESAVRAGGNAIQIISSLLSAEFPREVIVIARAYDCKFRSEEREKAKPATGG